MLNFAKYFSASVEIITWFSPLSVNIVNYKDFWILNKPWISERNTTWVWYIIILVNSYFFMFWLEYSLAPLILSAILVSLTSIWIWSHGDMVHHFLFVCFLLQCFRPIEFVLKFRSWSLALELIQTMITRFSPDTFWIPCFSSKFCFH